MPTFISASLIINTHKLTSNLDKGLSNKRHPQLIAHPLNMHSSLQLWNKHLCESLLHKFMPLTYYLCNKRWLAKFEFPTHESLVESKNHRSAPSNKALWYYLLSSSKKWETFHNGFLRKCLKTIFFILNRP